jgi:hypothetical protein
VTWRTGILLALLIIVATSVQAGTDDGEAVHLRRWYLGFQFGSGDRDQWDVFARDDLPQAPVESPGRGGAFLAGYRFGDRFLLGLHLGALRYDMTGSADRLLDVETLVTGTVLFRERDTFQPFLRGGFGAAAVVLDYEGGETFSYGTAVVGGGGLQVRLSSRFSLEWELTARFTNYHEVNDDPADAPEQEWKIKMSQTGWRSGLGVMIWF